MTTTTNPNNTTAKINHAGDQTADAGAIGISVGSATLLLEVLDACDEFLRTAPHAVRVELAEFCLTRPGISSGVLIDTVGLHALHLRARLADQQAAAARQGRRR